MKSTVEPLSPTRVRLAVEVPFDELKPSLDKAYRSIAGQVRVPGFRPGKVPARIIDQRVGRAAVLEQAVNDAIPQQYTAAILEHDVKVLGQPAVDVTEFADGEQLKFTAEVDVRPEVTLPAYDGLAVTVDDAEVTDEEIDEQIAGLRERFALLQGVDRPAQTGDFVSVDLHATVDGAEVDGGSTTGLSYEVGSGQLIPGLDEALVGLGKGEEESFGTQLVEGEYAGREAQVAVTVRSVKEKHLPELDDDFAETASEFDTLNELRADIRDRLGRIKRLQQASAARDRVLEVLLEAVDVPLPQSVVQAEVDYRKDSMEQQLTDAGLTLEGYLESEGRPLEEVESDLRGVAERAVKAQLVLDAVADAEGVSVSDAELTQEVLHRAQRAGVAPDEFVQQVVQSGQIPMLAADVRRTKALALVLERSTITDAGGRGVDLNALRADLAAPAS
ncbi:MAG: trigger factor [Actinomycetota bacterium]|nr:trigger factor [Actinomycetota bacterium]